MEKLGAELFHRWLKHLGPNEIVLPLACKDGRRYLPNRMKTERYLGGPLSEELWNALRDNGSRYISVFHHDPTKTDLEYHDSMKPAFSHVVILITEDGYVVNIFMDMWYKGIR